MFLSKMSHFVQRIIVSSFAIVFLTIAIGLSMEPYFKPIFTLILTVIISTSVWEFYHIARAKGVEPLYGFGIGFTVLYIFATFLSTQYSEARCLPEIVLVLALFTAFLSYFAKGTDPFVNLAITLFAIVYLTIPLTCTVSINYFFSLEGSQDGRVWLVYLICVTKMTDIGAFFAGKKFGKFKLAPIISPKKTWEGAFGGLIASLGTSLFFYVALHTFFSPSPPILLSLGQSVFLGIFLGIIAQFGDLAESLLKRDVGVKDSNHFPGLGGMLDIVDSLVFAAPVVYIFLRIQTKDFL